MPVLLGIVLRAGEKCELRVFETVFVERTDEGRFAACFGERAGGNGFIEQNEIADGEIALFEDEF